MRTPIALAFSLCLAVPVAAQAVTPYGTATAGSAGIAPRIWIQGEPRLGNLGFLLTLDRGLGGAPAVLALSDAAASVPLAGARLLVDPSSPFFAVLPPVTLAGAPGVPGAGTSFQRLGIPNVPALEGLDLYAQWVVADAAAAGGLAASDGVRMTVRREATLLGVLSTGLESLTPGGATAVQPWTMVSGALFGRDVSVTRDGTTAVATIFDFPSGLRTEVFDVTTVPPAPFAGLARAASTAAVHPLEDLAYVVEAQTVGILDVDRASPTFGQSIGSIPGLSLVSDLDLSPGGRVALAHVFLSTLAVIDVEPGSPTRHTVLRNLTHPRATALIELALAADGQSYFASEPDGSIAQYTTAAAQRVAQTAPLPGLPQRIVADTRGRFLVIATDAPGLTVVDLEPGPSFFTTRSFPVATPLSDIALPADGTTVVAATGSTYEVYDLATGVRFFSTPSTGAVAGFALR